MIYVSHHDNSIAVTGHAHYAPSGQDIVCAGVSSLVQTLIRSIEELTEDKIKYDISLGAVKIQYENLSESAHILVGSFFVGIRMITKAYPEYIKIV